MEDSSLGGLASGIEDLASYFVTERKQNSDKVRQLFKKLKATMKSKCPWGALKL